MTPELGTSRTKKSSPEQTLEALLKVDRSDNERRFRQMIDALPAAIYTTDAQGKITHFNPACVAFSGRTPTLGSDHWCVTWKLFYPDGRPMPHDECPMAIALKHGRVVRGAEAIAERPDGTRIWFQPYPMPLFDEEGRLTGGINMLVDITERKAAEAAIQRDLDDSRRLHAISTRLLGEGDVDALLHEILSAAVDIAGADMGNIQVFDKDRGELLIRLHRGFSAPFLNYFARVQVQTASCCARSLQTNGRVLVPDVEASDLFHEESRAVMREAGARAVQSTPLVARSGQRVGTLSTHWRLPHLPNERELRLVDALARQAADLLERSEVEKALRASERELSDLFEAASIGLHWVGPDGIIQRVNRAELDMLGYRREEYVGRHIAEFHADPSVIEDILPRLTRGERLQEHPARLRCKDGSIREVLINSSALFENGRFIHTRCFTIDVTERKQAEAAGARLAAIVQSSDDAIISKDLNGVIQSWNAAAQRLFGYTAEQAVGRHISFLIPPERLHEEEQILARLRAGERVYHFDTVRVRSDGQPVHVSLTISPVRDESGRIVGASKVVRDITDRKLAEEQTYQLLTQLQEADHRKDEFLAMLAHELRNPLAPLNNILEIMKREEGNGHMIEEVRSTLERQLGQMVRLVDDLLDVSRITRSKLEMRKERVELASVIQQSVEVCRPLAESARHQLSVSLPSEPISLHADPVRMAQVFGNLLNNACKYTEPGGRIWLTAKRQGSDVVVSVKDTGVGIPPDKLGTVFEMFTQIDRSLERSQGGLGIGLTLVKRLVEMHGGSVEARSEGQGRGSEFVVRVPLFVEKSQSKTPTAEQAPPTAHRILVVDDNRDAAASLAMLLKITGNETQTAHDGLAAVEAAATFRPDVVLLDIGLPKLNGYDACRRIREQPCGKNMVLVALTGWSQEEDRRQSNEAGFDHHMVKPVDLATLTELLAPQ